MFRRISSSIIVAELLLKIIIIFSSPSLAWHDVTVSIQSSARQDQQQQRLFNIFSLIGVIFNVLYIMTLKLEQILGRNLVKILFKQKLRVKKHNNNVNEYRACNTEITVEMEIEPETERDSLDR